MTRTPDVFAFGTYNLGLANPTGASVVWGTILSASLAKDANFEVNMLFENPKVSKLLKRIVSSVTKDETLHEDLTQEALIYLWQREIERPGQALCWYLRGCRFYLLDILDRGRSVDSYKRRHLRCDGDFCGEEDEEIERINGENVLNSVSTLDIFDQLCVRLSSKERTILASLANELGVREIAIKLRCSHQAVSKHRKRIAATARELGMAQH